MPQNNNIDTIEYQIETLKKNYESIKKLNQELNSNLVVEEVDGKKVRIPINKIIDQINNDLREINYPAQVYSINELDRLLSSLKKNQQIISSKISEFNNNNASIAYLSQEIEMLKRKIKNTDYYSGLNRIKKILLLHSDPSKKELMIDNTIIINREIIDQLNYICEHLKYRINEDEYHLLQNKLSKFIFEDNTSEKNEQLTDIVNDLRIGISKIEEKKEQSELAIKLKSIEFKQRNIALGLKRLDLNTLSKLFTDSKLKENLENFYKENQLNNRENLTLDEIINLLNKNLENKEEFITLDNSKVEKLQGDLSSDIEKINLLMERNKNVNIPLLTLKNAQFIKSIEYVSICIKIRNNNYNALNSLKNESNQIIEGLTSYQENMLENIIDEVQKKMEELDSYIYDSEKMKNFLLEQDNNLEKKYDKLTEKEKIEQFSKHYLYQSNSIYIEAIKAFSKHKITIPLLIDEYDYHNIGNDKVSKINKMKQFFNDLDDFFDTINSQSRKKTRSILKRNKEIPKNITMSRNIYTKQLSLSEDNNKNIKVVLNNLSSRFIDYNKKIEKLKLSREEVSKQLIAKLTTDVAWSTDDLGDYGRNFERKMNAAKLIEEYMNSNDQSINEILGNDIEGKHK